MLFQSAYLVNESFMQSDYIYVPLLKKTSIGYTKYNKFLIKSISPCIPGRNRIVTNRFMLILMHRLNSKEYKDKWNRLFPENTVDHFINKYGLYSAGNDKSEAGLKVIRRNKSFSDLEYVKRKLNLSDSPILVVGCRLIDWQNEAERKPSSNYRSSSADRFDKIATRAVDLGYQVVSVGDPNFKLGGNDERIVNYANSKLRDSKLDVLIVTNADLIVGNLFGALDMRYLSEKIIPFFSVDNPLPSIFFNNRITMALPTIMTDSGGEFSCLSEIMKTTNWDGVGWTTNSAERIFHKSIPDDQFLDDFNYFIEFVNSVNIQKVDLFVKQVFEYIPKKYRHLNIQVKESSCILSPQYIKYLENSPRDIFC